MKSIKLLSRILAIALAAVLFCAVGMGRSTAVDGYIYYSDLFYGYNAYYFFQRTWLGGYDESAEDTMESIFNTYMNSAEGLLTQIKPYVDATTDIKDLIELLLSIPEGAGYSYNRTLDKANQLYAQKLLSNALDASDGACCGVAGRIAELTKQVSTFLNDKIDEISALADTNDILIYLITELTEHFDFDALQGLPSGLFENLKPALEQAGAVMETVQDTINTVKAVSVALIIENVRLELIDNLIAAAPSDSCLYDGMTRLRYQLRDGWASYFLDTYVTDFMLEKLSEAAMKAIEKAVPPYAIIRKIIDVASYAVFDLLLDVAELDDCLAQKTLLKYTKESYEALTSQLQAFNDQFSSENITVYEDLYVGYQAAVDAGIEMTQELAFSSNQYLVDGLRNLHGNFSYWAYINRIKESIRQTSEDQIVYRAFSDWNVPSDTKLLAASDVIEPGAIYTFNGAIQGNVTMTGTHPLVTNCDPLRINGNLTCETLTFSGIHLITTGQLQANDLNLNGGTLSANGGLAISSVSVTGSNEIIHPADVTVHSLQINNGGLIVPGAFNTYDLYFNGGSISAAGGLTAYSVSISGDNTINGNASFVETEKSCLYTYFESGSLTVNGDLTVSNTLSMTHDNDRLLVTGDLSINPAKNSSSLTAGEVEVKGDLTITKEYSCNYYETDAHRTILSGNKEQIVTMENGSNSSYNQFMNLILENTNVSFPNPFSWAGLCQDTVVTNEQKITLLGSFLLNGFSFTTAGEVEISSLAMNGGSISAAGGLTANSVSIKGNNTVNGNASFLHTERGNTYTSFISGSLTVNGNLTVDNTLEMTHNDDRLLVTGDLSINPTKSESSLTAGEVEVKGDLTITKDYSRNYYETGTHRTILSGNKKQIVTMESSYNSYYNQFSTLILTNTSPEGVVFASPITVTTLFHHEGKAFTLYDGGTGSSFPDYDNDGLRDHIDPFPTRHQIVIDVITRSVLKEYVQRIIAFFLRLAEFFKVHQIG